MWWCPTPLSNIPRQWEDLWVVFWPIGFLHHLGLVSLYHPGCLSIVELLFDLLWVSTCYRGRTPGPERSGPLRLCPVGPLNNLSVFRCEATRAIWERELEQHQQHRKNNPPRGVRNENSCTHLHFNWDFPTIVFCQRMNSDRALSQRGHLMRAETDNGVAGMCT